MSKGKSALEKFEFVFGQFVHFINEKWLAQIGDSERESNESDPNLNDDLKTLLCAFNRLLSGENHPQYKNAFTHLTKPQRSALLSNLAAFLRKGITDIRQEITSVAEQDIDFSRRLNEVYEQLLQIETDANQKPTFELFWKLFFPEGTGILANKNEAEKALRRKRLVTISKTMDNPIENPAAEILFTSNVLLTTPLKSWDIDALDLSDRIKAVLKANQGQPQEFWYDHPIPIGISDEHNEVLYGLRGLENMMAFEKARGTVRAEQKLTVVLSCSVTHSYLQEVAKEYLQQLIQHSGGFQHLKVFLFLEPDVRSLVNHILLPAFKRVASKNAMQFDPNIFDVLGVDGPYGRHYSFLKAIALFWQIFIDPKIKATFKIDLDQVFDEERLVAETGKSALEHFKSNSWGADGLDVKGQPIHLGMIAGALVNAHDISKSLFTPDVPYPPAPQHADEFVFFSRLPQALSTRAEMMARYNEPNLDGQHVCLQRVHVTGGTNGILIEALRRFKPFTPSFIGRAEDQAYLLSTMVGQGKQLGYLHKDGLIMRHDKEWFTQEAIRAAEIGKLIGDYERILYFSYYARLLDPNYRRIKERVDPFTGCFISAIPLTVAYLRFVFKLKDFLEENRLQEAREFVEIGIPRLNKAIEFCTGKENYLRQQYVKEKQQWEAYYRTLNTLSESLAQGADEAISYKAIAKREVEALRIV